jgi:hypothetical protein
VVSFARPPLTAHKLLYFCDLDLENQLPEPTEQCRRLKSAQSAPEKFKESSS